MYLLNEALLGLCRINNFIDITVLARRRFGGRGGAGLLTGL